jgi:hypothetical protein
MRSKAPKQYKALFKLSKRFTKANKDTPASDIIYYGGRGGGSNGGGGSIWSSDDDYMWYINHLRDDKDLVVIHNYACYNKMDARQLVETLVAGEDKADVRERLLQEPDMYKLYWLLLDEGFLIVSQRYDHRQGLHNYMRRNDAQKTAKFVYVTNWPEEEEERKKTSKLLVLAEKYKTEDDAAKDLAFVRETCDKMAAIVKQFEDGEKSSLRKRKSEDDGEKNSSHKRKRD